VEADTGAVLVRLISKLFIRLFNQILE